MDDRDNRERYLNPAKFYGELIERAQGVDELADSLAQLLADDVAVWRDGRLYFIRQLVEAVNGLKIEIYPNEYPPPHFHVRGGDIDAVFDIRSGDLLSGEVGNRERKLIKVWHSHASSKLIKIWNETRPTGCSVGPIADFDP